MIPDNTIGPPRDGIEGYWMHQWCDNRHPITVYRGDTLLAEYQGRGKLLRAWLCILRDWGYKFQLWHKHHIAVSPPREDWQGMRVIFTCRRCGAQAWNPIRSDPDSGGYKYSLPSKWNWD